MFDDNKGAHIDRVLTDKSCAYIERNAAAKRPFFLFLSLSAVHVPVYVDPDFASKSGVGNIGDAVMAMDHDVGRVLDSISKAGIIDNTIVIFTSDNGPEYQQCCRGNAGPWRGTYATALEGGLRVPFVMRWPGHVPAGCVSDGMVHIVDLFTTLAPIAGAKIPTDRAIDGVDQLALFTGQEEKSPREGFPIFVFGELWAVKWQDWKLHEVWRPAGSLPLTRAHLRDGYILPLPSADPRRTYVRKLFNLCSDPKEETNVLLDNRSVVLAMDHVVADFQKSLEAYPLIRAGTPDPYQPPRH